MMAEVFSRPVNELRLLLLDMENVLGRDGRGQRERSERKVGEKGQRLWRAEESEREREREKGY